MTPTQKEISSFILMSDVDSIKYQTLRSITDKFILATKLSLTWLDDHDLGHNNVDEKSDEEPHSVVVPSYPHVGQHTTQWKACVPWSFLYRNCVRKARTYENFLKLVSAFLIDLIDHLWRCFSILSF